MNRVMIGCALGALFGAAGLGAGAADAQTAMGLRGGLRSAALETGQSVGAISETVYGAYLGFGLTDRLAFQMEAVYGTRGGTGLALGTDALDDAATPVRVDMRYIEVPLLLRTGFPGERLLPSFFVGPYAAFLLGCDATPDGAASASCDAEGATQRFSPRSTDVGVIGGAGFDIAIGESTVFVDARYTLGLLSIQAGADPFDVTHSGLEVTAGFAVPLGR